MSLSKRSIRTLEIAVSAFGFESGSADVEIVWVGAEFVVADVCAPALHENAIDRSPTKTHKNPSRLEAFSKHALETRQTLGTLAFMQLVLGGMRTIAGWEMARRENRRANALWGVHLNKHTSLYSVALVIASNSGSTAVTMPEKTARVEASLDRHVV